MQLIPVLDIRSIKVRKKNWVRRPNGYISEVSSLLPCQMMWPLPCLRAHYKSDPGHFLTALLGHEGPGSILSLLKVDFFFCLLVVVPT